MALRPGRILGRLGDRELFGALTVRDLLGVIVLWAAYCFAVSFVATSITRDPGVSVSPTWRGDMLGYVQDLPSTPPLARWDSVWYLSIATEGFAPPTGRGVNNVSFMPLYGVAMRVVARAFAIPPLDAGVAVSQACLLLALISLFIHARDRGLREPIAACVAVLAFPSGYLLTAVYSESTFFAAAMTAWMLAGRQRWFASGFFALLAGYARFHALALAPGLFLLGLAYWWPKRREARALVAFVPALATTLAVFSVGYYCHVIANDWLLPIHRKAAFGMTTGGPLEAWRSTMVYFPEALRRHGFGNMYTLVEGPTALFMAVVAAALCWKRQWAEAAFVALCLSMSLRAGTLWGLPRYALFAFPLWTTLGRAQRWPGVFHGYVFVGVLWQACILVNYVDSRAPAP